MYNYQFSIPRPTIERYNEGARDARGGERQFAAGLAESDLHLFEPVQLLL
jgi:hypothetical protein